MYIREQPPKGEQYTEYGTRGTDCYPRVTRQRPHHLLREGGTQTANKVVECEFFTAPLVLDHGTKHPQREHIAEDVPHVGVHEHIRQRLPNMEGMTLKIKQSQRVRQLNAVTLE